MNRVGNINSVNICGEARYPPEYTKLQTHQIRKHLTTKQTKSIYQDLSEMPELG